MTTEEMIADLEKPYPVFDRDAIVATLKQQAGRIAELERTGLATLVELSHCAAQLEAVKRHVPPNGSVVTAIRGAEIALGIDEKHRWPTLNAPSALKARIADLERENRELAIKLESALWADLSGQSEPQNVPGLEVVRPKIVCLCGSSRFYEAYQQANYDLTMQGVIVLSIGFYPHAKATHGHGEGVGHDSAQKIALDELHKRKIDLADEVLVLNVGGYIGDSTRSEVEHARQLGKPVKWLEPGKDSGFIAHPAPEGKTVRVRVAVAVNACGAWVATGLSDDSENIETVLGEDYDPYHDNGYWLVADLIKPDSPKKRQITEIPATVERVNTGAEQ